MNTVAWKAYEEVHFSDKYILRWIREDDEYVNKITKEMMEDLKSVVRQQQAEIEALKAVLEQEGIGVGRDLLNGGIALFRKASEK